MDEPEEEELNDLPEISAYKTFSRGGTQGF